MKRCFRILLANDEGTIQTTLRDYLSRLGHQVESVFDGHTGLQSIDTQDYDLALIGSQMPGSDGMELLAKVQKIRPEMPIIIISGHETTEMLIQTFRLDSTDFRPKPIPLSNIKKEIDKAKPMGKLHRGHQQLQKTLSELKAGRRLQQKKRRLVGESSATQQVRVLINQAVKAEVDTILITGETGTGKEVVSREIHFQAASEKHPFIAVNCPAMPESLAESELFGHVKGAFTGATMDRAGCFELADDGTLFLDEIADLALPMQAKLLRVLETRTLRRVGGMKEIAIDERVIGAMNTDPTDLVESGRFRRDLFYRLNLFPIHLKPLRERTEDILPHGIHFLDAYAARSGRTFEGFSQAAAELLLNHHYPGNARELRNIVERAAILCPLDTELIDAKHIEIQRSIPKTTSSQNGKSADSNERDWILRTLEKARWNRRQASQILGIPYSTLRFKMKTLGIS